MLDPSEVDRIVEVARLPLMRLVDWKNRVGDPFHLRATPLGTGLFRCEIDLPQPVTIEQALPLIHGEFEKREEDGAVVYASLPGNTLGQTATPDGRPVFGIAYDLTSLDTEGRPQLKVYFGTTSQWFVKSEYHARWQDLREVREELEPQKAQPPRREEPPGGARELRKALDEREGGGGRRRRGRRGGRGRNKARSD